MPWHGDETQVDVNLFFLVNKLQIYVNFSESFPLYLANAVAAVAAHHLHYPV